MRRRLSSHWLRMVLVGGLLLGGCSSSLFRAGQPAGRPISSEMGDSDSEGGIAPRKANGEYQSTMLRKKPTRLGLTDEVHVVDLLFDVVRVDLPINPPVWGMRHSRKIWNHVDELRVDPEQVGSLGRNGLRIGAASPDAWPAIRAILHAADAVVRRDQLVAQRDLPLAIKLGSIHEAESMFSYGPDRRLVGKTFPAGDKLLNLDYVFHPEFGGCTDLRLSFEVRHDRGVMTWEKRDGVIREVPACDRHIFTEVDALLTLNADEFLVIGLSDQAENEYLIGSRFLTFERSGSAYETLLCVTPKPYQTQGVRRWPS